MCESVSHVVCVRVCVYVCVCVSVYAANITELRNLPHWHTQVVLCLHSATKLGLPVYTWPIARAPWALPRSYKQWGVHDEELSPGELIAFLGNAPGDRTCEEPLTIILYDCEWDRTFLDSMARTGLFPHVRVVDS